MGPGCFTYEILARALNYPWLSGFSNNLAKMLILISWIVANNRSVAHIY